MCRKVYTAVAVRFSAIADDNASAGDVDVDGLLYGGRDYDDGSEAAMITEKLLLLLRLRLWLIFVLRLLLQLYWTLCCRMLVYDIVIDRVFVIVWVVQLLMLLVVRTTFCCCI